VLYAKQHLVAATGISVLTLGGGTVAATLLNSIINNNTVKISLTFIFPFLAILSEIAIQFIV